MVFCSLHCAGSFIYYIIAAVQYQYHKFKWWNIGQWITIRLSYCSVSFSILSLLLQHSPGLYTYPEGTICVFKLLYYILRENLKGGTNVIFKISQSAANYFKAVLEWNKTGNKYPAVRPGQSILLMIISHNNKYKIIKLV